MDGVRISRQSQRSLMSGVSLCIGLVAITSVATAQEPPVCQCMDLVFLQDVTGSMSSLDHVRAEVLQVLDLAEAEVPGGLRAGVISFGDTIVVDQQLSEDTLRVRAAIAGMAAQGGEGAPEPSDEALREALTESICEPCGYKDDLVIGDFDATYRKDCRKIAVLVTDNLPAGCDDHFNGDDGVRDDLNAHLRALEALAKEVQIAAVLVGSGTGTVEDIMRDYAETTGGIFVRVNGSVPEISDALASFIAECVDCNLDNTVDPVDLAKGVPDCDDNDVPDICQKDVFCTSGFPTACQPPTDCNSNSTPDLCEIRDGSPDCNLNGVIDNCEPNCNGNSLPDECDLDSGTSQDCNANAIPDECDIASSHSEDCDGNGVPDECEWLGWCDCNENGRHDACDIAIGASMDCNANEIPDECEGVLYVDQDAPGPHDGSTWEKAFLTLHEALTAAAGSGGAVEFIFVAEGTYQPNTSGLSDLREATFQLLNNVTISGGYAGYGQPSPCQQHHVDFRTILTGDLNGDDGPGFTNRSDNCYHVLTGSGTNDTAILDGFTIIGGNANGSTAGNKDRGGGMLNLGGSPTVRNCRFVGNSATMYGGAMYNGLGGTSTHSIPSLVDCAFSGNWATNGGAIYNRQDSACTLTNCTIVGNSATTLTGGVRCELGVAKTILANCIAWGNTDSQSTDVLRRQISAGSYTAVCFEVTYSCIADGTPGDGLDVFGDPANHNIDLDPALALNNGAGADSTFGTLDDDLRVRNGSPCIDAADNTAVPSEVLFDAASTSRFLDDPATADTGNGLSPIVDMGAYEYDYLNDCNGNGVPDEVDISSQTSTDCDSNGIPDECDPDNDHDTPGCGCVVQPGCTCGPDACDVDDDNDGVWDVDDNCDFIANPDQTDCDGDGQGNACDATPGALGDFDDDCDVDQSDFAHMQACQGSTCSCGPGPGCDCCESAWPCYDAWFSGYVTYEPYDVIREVVPEDMVLFERCISSPGVAMTSVCGDCNDDGVHDAQQDFDGDDSPDGDADTDGVDVRGLALCVRLSLNDPIPVNCDDNCPCVANADQLDSDGDGIGDACDSTPYGPPEGSPNPCDTPENYFTITAWRSIRTHGAAGSLGIALDPDAAPNEAVIEPRQGSTQRIEVDLTQPAYPWTDVSFIQVTGSDASQPVPSGYAFLNNDQTLRISFNAADPNNRLNDQVCYTIDLSNAIVDAGITTMVMCDADCAIRMLAADADENAAVEQADVSAIAAANGQTAGSSNVRLDVNVDGVINGTDESIATGLIGNTVTCGGGMMSVGGEGVEITARPMKKLLGARDRSTADPSSSVGVAFSQSFSSAPATDLLTLLREAVASGQPLPQQGTTDPPPSANVSAQWAVHGTGATSVTLPATGGTILVDLVITTDTPIWGFEGKPAVDAANVVSIDSADWTELDNVLMSYGQTVTSAEAAASQPPTTLASHYDLTVMDWLWVRLTPDGSDVTAWGMDVDSLLGTDPPTVWTLTQDLTVINGPIATSAVEPAIESPEPIQWFTTTAGIGGVTREPLPAGQTILATLSLTISAQPGTYRLTLTAPQFTDTTHVTFPATTGQPLQIVVGQ